MLTPAPQAECRSLTFSANFRNTTLACRSRATVHGGRSHYCLSIVVRTKVCGLAILQRPGHRPLSFYWIVGWFDRAFVVPKYRDPIALRNELAGLEQRIVDVVAEH